LEFCLPEFIPGLKLSELFYHEAVRPLLDRHFPGLPHSAALIGSGSDVIGCDTPRSTDHGWGPRLDLFLPQADSFDRLRAPIDEMLRSHLPYTFHGYSTNFERESRATWARSTSSWIPPTWRITSPSSGA